MASASTQDAPRWRHPVTSLASSACQEHDVVNRATAGGPSAATAAQYAGNDPDPAPRLGDRRVGVACHGRAGPDDLCGERRQSQHRHRGRQCHESVEKSIAIHGGTTVSVGVTPNGTRAYALVVGSDEVGSPGVLVPISTTTNTTGKAISVGVNPYTFAFNPNGRYAYVVDGFDAATTAPNAPGTITPVNLADEAAGRPIKVGHEPWEHRHHAQRPERVRDRLERHKW